MVESMEVVVKVFIAVAVVVVPSCTDVPPEQYVHMETCSGLEDETSRVAIAEVKVLIAIETPGVYEWCQEQDGSTSTWTQYARRHLRTGAIGSFGRIDEQHECKWHDAVDQRLEVIGCEVRP